MKVNWASGLDANGRPIQTPQPAGHADVPWQSGRDQLVLAVVQSAHRTLLSLRVGRLRVDLQPRDCRVRARPDFRRSVSTTLTPVPGAPGPGIGRRSPINTWTDAVAHGAVIAIDPKTGQQKWKFDQFDVTESGNLTTAGDLLFTGGREGYFYALDARTGTLLWKSTVGGQIVNGPITYQVDGKQYVATISGNSLIVYGLRD